MKNLHSICLSIASLLVLAGCASHPLMPAPNIYTGAAGYPETEVPAKLKSNKVDLLYVTDRDAIVDDSGALTYGSERSDSVAFGSVLVELGEGIGWQELVHASQSQDRSTVLEVKVRSRREIGRFPPTPHAFSLVDGVPVEDPEVVAERARAEALFRRELDRRLADTSTKEVFIYVHGFNNSFDFAASAHAETWHFLGRRGVPILYTWPAAHGGLLGYFVDRESGEFTIYHLKQLIRMLVSFPEVERINIIAHSRGTDITTTALRELVIEARAVHGSAREHLRIANLVLAAPDLDFGVVRQRLVAEKFGPAIGRITIYTTRADTALKVSESFMSGRRFGRLEVEDLGATDEAIFAEVPNLSIIEVQDVKGLIRHGYFRGSPAASSDLILVLRGGGRPGDTQRPLTHVKSNFWRLPAGYPHERP